MKAKSLLLLLLSSTLLYSSSIEELVQTSFKKNDTIASLQKAINGAKQSIVLATKWQNPVVSFGANDIQFENPTKRDLEAMQAQFVGVTQVIPTGDKLKYKEQIALKDKEILAYVLEDKKLELQSKIYELSFSIIILEKKLVLLEEYLQNIKKLQELNIALYENNQALQTQALNSQINYFKVNLEKIELHTLIKNLYIELEEITQQKIQSLQMNYKLSKKALYIEYENHPKLKIQELIAKKAFIQAKLEDESAIADVSFNLSYFQRDSKHKDYINFSLSIPLSIYETHKVKTLIAKSKNYEELSRLKSLEKEFKKESLVLNNEYKNALKTVTLLQETILPLQKKVQKSVELYNTIQKVKPQVLISSLNDKIKYELLLLDKQLEYFQTLAKAFYYNKGVI